MTVVPLLLSALFGCSFGLTPVNASLEDTSADPGGDGGGGRLRISGLEPTYGVTAGGDEVVITGGPFDDDTTVKFGSKLADVLDVSDDEIRVETPPQSEAGPVDVQVADDRGSEATEEAGFDYYTDGTGKTGIIGEFTWTHIVGDYWGSQPVDSGAAWFSVIDPRPLAHWELYAAQMGGCSADFAGPGYTVLPGEGTASLESDGSGPVRLTWSAENEQFATPLEETEYLNNTAYDLADLTLPGYPEFALPGVVRTPAPFTVTSPALDGTRPPDLPQTLRVTWTGASGDAVVVFLGMLNGGGTAYEASVGCVANPSAGQIQVPAGTWSSWVRDRQVNVFVGVVRVGAGTIDFNHAESQFAGIYWVYGAGFAN